MAMAMYALGTLPLIHHSNPDNSVIQTRYADDKVKVWVEELTPFQAIALSQPQSAYLH